MGAGKETWACRGSGHSISLRAEAAKLAPEVRWSGVGGGGGEGVAARRHQRAGP